MHSEVGASHEQEANDMAQGAGLLGGPCGQTLAGALGLSEPSSTLCLQVNGGGNGGSIN